MKKVIVNKILVVFIVGMLAVLVGLSAFVQSKYFGEIISGQVNKYIKANVDIDIEFSRIQISLLPLSTTIEDVRIYKENLLRAKLGEIEVKLSPIDILKSNMNISEITVRNGYFDISKNPSQENSEEGFDLKEFRNPTLFMKKQIEMLPVKVSRFELEGVDVLFEDKLIQIREASLELKNQFRFNLAVENFKYEKYSYDSIVLNGEMDKEKILVKKIEIVSRRAKVQANGSARYENEPVFQFNIEYEGELADFNPTTQNFSGLCDCKLALTTKGREIRYKSSGQISNFKSDFQNVEKLEYSVSGSEEILSIASVEINDELSTLKTTKEFSVNIKTNEISEIEILADNYDLYKGLVPSMGEGHTLSGLLSGALNLKIKGKELGIVAKSKIRFNQIKVGTQKKILELKDIEFDTFKVDVGEQISILANGKIGTSKTYIAGNIFKESLALRLKIDDFELSELGGVVGNVISGKGQMDAAFDGKLNDIQLKLFANNVNSLKVLGYDLVYDSNVEMTYQFKENLILLHKINASEIIKINNGYVDLNNDLLDIDIKFKNLISSDLEKHLFPMKENLTQALASIHGELNGQSTISGKFENMTIKNSIATKKVAIFSEPLSNARLEFEITNKKIKVSEMILSRAEGELALSLLYDFQSGIQKLDLNANGIRLYDFLIYRNLGLGYDAEINAKVKIENKQNSLTGGGMLRFLSSSVGRKKIKPSNISFDLLNDNVVVKGSLLGTRISFDSNLYFGKLANKKSSLTSKIDVEDVRLILGMISLHNIYDSELSGNIRGNMKAEFALADPENLDVSLALEQFKLAKYDKEINLDSSSSNKIKIQKSEIEEFDIAVEGSGGKYKIKGFGNFKSRAKLEQEFTIDLSYAHILSQKILRAGGKISGSGIILGNFHKFDDSHSLNAQNVLLVQKDVPLLISDLSLNSVITTKKWELNTLSGNVGSGRVTGKGRVDFELPYPKINVGLKLDNISYPVADNSRVLVDAFVDLVGNKFPYSLRGNIFVNGGDIQDEFTAFTGGGGVKKSVDKYIEIKKQGLPDVVVLNVDVKTTEHIRIKNRMADILLTGTAKIADSPTSPTIKSKISLVPVVSKFKFKGTDFLINEGFIEYDSGNTLNSLYVNLTSIAKIGQYDIKMEVVGSDDDLKLNMESNPTLSKEDIFSLLALGVTSDFAKNLEDKDRTSLTTIGLGTLIVDQLKINEGLDSTLGLKLSVLPEIGDNDSTPIQNSKNEALSKNKTATKLRIQKKVTENVGLTFANTFGSSEGQKQEMNIDLNINKKWSIQGVFESETDTEAGDGNSNSLGADIKYRWDF